MPNAKYDQTPTEAIEIMEQELLKMRADTDREQLKGISADDALEIGYEMALRDYKSLTGPDPFEVGITVVKAKEKN